MIPSLRQPRTFLSPPTIHISQLSRQNGRHYTTAARDWPLKLPQTQSIPGHGHAPTSTVASGSQASASSWSTDASLWLCLYYHLRLFIVSEDAAPLLWFNDERIFIDFTLYFRDQATSSLSINDVLVLREQVASTIMDHLRCFLRKLARHKDIRTYHVSQIAPMMMTAYKAIVSAPTRSQSGLSYDFWPDLQTFVRNVVDQEGRNQGPQATAAPATASASSTSSPKSSEFVTESLKNASEVITTAGSQTSRHRSIVVPGQSTCLRATTRPILLTRTSLDPNQP